MTSAPTATGWLRRVLPAALAGTLAALVSTASTAATYYPIYATWPQPDGPGTPITLTYSYSNFLDGGMRDSSGTALPVTVLRSAIETALQDYADVLPIHFVEVADSGPAPGTGQYDPQGHADIRIGYVPQTDANAYAWFPNNPQTSGLAGDVVFNASRFGLGWSPLWVYAVGQHELGHSLGMGHAATAGEGAMPGDSDLHDLALPIYDGPRTPLADEMLLALQTAYGAGTGSVTPLSPVNEPGTALLLSSALGLFALIMRRRQPDTGLDVVRAREAG